MYIYCLFIIIYLFLDVLGLHWCVRFPLASVSWGYSSFQYTASHCSGFSLQNTGSRGRKLQ